MKQAAHISFSLDTKYKKKLIYLAELEHRRLSQQIIHMTEFYLQHQDQTKKLLEQYIQREYKLEAIVPNYINTVPRRSIQLHTRAHRLKTSQILQENKGIIVSDIPEKKIKNTCDNLSS